MENAFDPMSVDRFPTERDTTYTCTVLYCTHTMTSMGGTLIFLFQYLPSIPRFDFPSLFRVVLSFSFLPPSCLSLSGSLFYTCSYVCRRTASTPSIIKFFVSSNSFFPSFFYSCFDFGLDFNRSEHEPYLIWVDPFWSDPILSDGIQEIWSRIKQSTQRKKKSHYARKSEW